MKWMIVALSTVGLGIACLPQKETSNVKRVPVKTGILYVDPAGDPLITGGVVQYRLYANGDIYYSGDVSYFGNNPLTELQVPFNGSYRARPQDLFSSTYSELTNIHTSNKVTFVVRSVDEEAKTAEVAAAVTNFHKVDSTDARGTILVDLSEPMIGIKSADINGTIYQGTSYEVNINLRLTSQKPAE